MAPPTHPQEGRLMVTMLKPRLGTIGSRIKAADMTVSATKRTRGDRWMRIRSSVLRRDCGLCQTCKADGRLTLAREVDHKLALADGGTDDEANLQSICDDCHKAKTAAEANARRG